MSASADAVKSGLLDAMTVLGVDLESVEVQKAGRRHVVRVVVDRDGGLDLDLIAEVSRRVSELLDEPPLSDELPGPFVLEVTSPGVDRPLTEPRHWRRAVSRLVQATMADDSVVEGRVVSVPSDSEVVLLTNDVETTIALADVRGAVVQVEFNRVDAVDLAEAEEDIVTDDEEGE